MEYSKNFSLVKNVVDSAIKDYNIRDLDKIKYLIKQKHPLADYIISIELKNYYELCVSQYRILQ